MSWFSDFIKIDSAATNGMNPPDGVNNSLAYRVHEIEKHFHNEEHWYGSDGDSSGSTANNMTEWNLTAGTGGAYGTEVQLLAANDVSNSDFSFTPVKFDLHRILVTNSSTNDTNYVIQIWTGTGTFGEASFATEVPYRTGSANSEVSPIYVMMSRAAVADKVWGRVKSETNGADLDILIGIHAYIG